MISKVDDLNYDKIPGYPDGADITLLNTFYIRPQKQENGKYGDDSLTVIFRDNKTGEKKHHTFYKPKYTFYMPKAEFEKDYNPFFEDKENCVPIVVPYKDLELEIANITGRKSEFYDNCRNGNRFMNKLLHYDTRLLNSDMNIEDYYRYLFSKRYTNNIFKIKKGYCDIEVDGTYSSSEFPEPGECPINAVSYIDDNTNTIYTFLLRNPNNPLIEEFEKSICPEFFDEVKELLIKTVGGWKKATRLNFIDTKFEIFFFDEEIEMIEYIFTTIRDLNPDFLLFWNASFDATYFIERIKKLGYNPVDIICDNRFQEKVCYYHVDQQNYSVLEARGDYCKLSSYFVLLCQMINFASRRKGQSAIEDFKLDTIGELIAGVHKLSYSHITHHIEELPYKDYKTFVMYNMIDPVVQRCIESITNDIDFIFAKCLVSNARYEKGYRQTNYLVNRFTKEFDKKGYIIGNNVNKTNKKEKKFPGALVGNPLNTDDYAKKKIDNKAIFVADNLMDEDYKSLYPNVDLENNMAPNTLIGAIEVPHKVYKNENIFNDEPDSFSRSGEMMDLYITGNANFTEFCHRYLHLANFEELLEDIEEYMQKTYNSTFNITTNGYINPFYVTKKEDKIKPFVEGAVAKNIQPITYYDEIPDKQLDRIIKDIRSKELWKNG